MCEYRLYFLDAGGHIHRALELECGGDEEAVAFARARADGMRLELWQRDRIVARLSPAEGPAMAEAS
jgi:hypothetical protein